MSNPTLLELSPELREEKVSMELVEAQRQQLLKEMLEQSRLASDEQQGVPQPHEVSAADPYASSY